MSNPAVNYPPVPEYTSSAYNQLVQNQLIVEGHFALNSPDIYANAPTNAPRTLALGSDGTVGTTNGGGGGGGTVTSITAGTGLSGGTITTSGTIANTGVLALTAGSGISLSGSNSNITITNTGGSGGVTSITAGRGITASASTGAVTISNALEGSIATGVYMPKGWGSIIGPKLSGAGSAQARIACIGDSITQGFHSNDFKLNSWVGVLRTSLQTSYGNGGTGFVSIINNHILTPFGPSDYPDSAMGVSLTGTSWTTDQRNGGPCNYYTSSDTTGDTMTFLNLYGSSLTVYYVTVAGAGNFTVTIGSTVTTINAGGGPSLGAVATFTITGISPSTNYSAVIANTTGYVGMFGVYAFNPTGVIVNNFGVSGDTTGSIVSNTNWGNALDYEGGVSFPVDCIIYELGVNDANGTLSGGAGSILAYQAAVISAIQRIREYTTFAGIGCEVIVLFPAIGTFQGSPGPPNYYGMMGSIYQLCDAYGIACLSIGAQLENSRQVGLNDSYYGSSTYSSTGAPGTDTVHPGNIGHSIIGNSLINLFSLAV